MTRYVFDGLGRRVRQIGADRSSTEYVWDKFGYLGETITRDPDGQTLATHRLWVDALGELAGVDGVPLWWDTATPTPSLIGAGGDQVLSLPGGLTGFGETWLNPSWRGARAMNTLDPWASIGVTTRTNPTPGDNGQGGLPGAGTGGGVAGPLPEGLGLSTTGGLNIAGLGWLGARAYDPASRGFLSTDPLPPVLGAGWDGNPYAYAGNNPLGMVDPTGLRPITDHDLKEFDSHAGSHWEYVAGVAIVGGAALMFVPGGQLVGMGLMSFGADVVIQKATTGEVNWGEAAVSGAVGMLGGGAMVAGRAAVAATSSVGRLGSYVAINTAVNGLAGAVGGGGTYLVRHGGRVDDWRGLLGSASGGAVSGAIGGLAGPAGGTLANASGSVAYSLTQTGVRKSIQALGAQTSIGSGGALAGTMTDKLISGERIQLQDVGWAALTGGALTHLPGGPSGSSTLQQAARTNVSTVRGLLNWGPNASGLVRSAGFGTSVGVGADLSKLFATGS